MSWFVTANSVIISYYKATDYINSQTQVSLPNEVVSTVAVPAAIAVALAKTGSFVNA